MITNRTDIKIINPNRRTKVLIYTNPDTKQKDFYIYTTKTHTLQG